MEPMEHTGCSSLLSRLGFAPTHKYRIANRPTFPYANLAYILIFPSNPPFDLETPFALPVANALFQVPDFTKISQRQIESN